MVSSVDYTIQMLRQFLHKNCLHLLTKCPACASRVSDLSVGMRISSGIWHGMRRHAPHTEPNQSRQNLALKRWLPWRSQLWIASRQRRVNSCRAASCNLYSPYHGPLVRAPNLESLYTQCVPYTKQGPILRTPSQEEQKGRVPN